MNPKMINMGLHLVNVMTIIQYIYVNNRIVRQLPINIFNTFYGATIYIYMYKKKELYI